MCLFICSISRIYLHGPQSIYYTKPYSRSTQQPSLLAPPSHCGFSLYLNLVARRTRFIQLRWLDMSARLLIPPKCDWNLPSISTDMPLDRSARTLHLGQAEEAHKTGRLPTWNAARAGLGSGIISAYTSFNAGKSRISDISVTQRVEGS